MKLKSLKCSHARVCLIKSAEIVGCAWRGGSLRKDICPERRGLAARLTTPDLHIVFKCRVLKIHKLSNKSSLMKYHHQTQIIPGIPPTMLITLYYATCFQQGERCVASGMKVQLQDDEFWGEIPEHLAMKLERACNRKKHNKLQQDNFSAKFKPTVWFWSGNFVIVLPKKLPVVAWRSRYWTTLATPKVICDLLFIHRLSFRHSKHDLWLTETLKWMLKASSYVTCLKF